MTKARKFRIEKAHIANAEKEDPDLANILPTIGYIVFPLRDPNAKPKTYKVDGFDVSMRSEVESSSMAPITRKPDRAFLLIGTDFSNDPSAIPYQNYLKKKGFSQKQMLDALVATQIHHESIHVRLQIDFTKGDFNKIKAITMEYILTLTHLNRSKEGRALFLAINKIATFAGMSEEDADTFTATEFEKFTQEKFTFVRVNRLTPGYHADNALIEESYFRHFETTLAGTAGSRFQKMKSNSHFLKTYTGFKNTAQKALTAYYAKYDTMSKDWH